MKIHQIVADFSKYFNGSRTVSAPSSSVKNIYFMQLNASLLLFVSYLFAQ